MQPQTSQILDAYLPLYDALPNKWEDAQEQLCERLREMTNAINNRSIGFYLDEELLSGKSLFPSNVGLSDESPLQFRSILRYCINSGPLVAGLNTIPHNIVFDSNFTLFHIWVSGTNSGTLTALTISGNNVVMNATTILVTSPQAFDRSITVVEYVQEL